GSITLAPEAGSQRMRDVINNNHTEDELLQSVATAAREGYTGAKLYFMCGLPGENDDDLKAILDLAARSWQRARDQGPPNFPTTRQRLPARAQPPHAIRVVRAGVDRRAQSPARCPTGGRAREAGDPQVPRRRDVAARRSVHPRRPAAVRGGRDGLPAGLPLRRL